MTKQAGTGAEDRRFQPGKLELTLRGLFVAFTITCLTLLFLVLRGNFSFSWITLLAGSLFFGLCILILVGYVPTRRKAPPRDYTGSVNLADLMGKKLSASTSQIEEFLNSVVQPADLRGRVVEEIRPLRRTVRQRVAVTLEMPSPKDRSGDPPEELYVPLLTPVKGDLQDDLQITLNGSHVATLTYNEYLLVTITGLVSLFVKALQEIEKNASPEAINEFNQVANGCLEFVAFRGSLDEDQHRRLDEHLESLRKLVDRATGAADALKLAISIVKKLSDNYVIIIVVPPSTKPGERNVVAYEQYQIPDLNLAQLRLRTVFHWVYDRVMLVFGARPMRLTVSAENAATAKSYHLQVFAPEGMYASYQHMPALREIFDPPKEKAGQAFRQPYRRFQRRRGQRYVHVYMRSVPQGVATRLPLSVTFLEVPPGSLASAAVAAIASFFLIWVISAVYGGSYSGHVSTDYPALVLAFPAVAGALVGYESRGSDLISGALSVRLSSLLTVVTSLLSSGLFIAQSAGRLRHPTGHGLLGVGDNFWQVILLLALLNAIVSAYFWLLRTATFYWLANRTESISSARPSEFYVGNGRH